MMMKRRSKSTKPTPKTNPTENLTFPRQSEHHKKPSDSSIIFSSLKRVFSLCLVFRIVNSFLIQTYFNPDEHWQSLEVAHRIAFGYGHLTWEWSKGIRSYLHPMVFVVLYKFLAFFRLDTPSFMGKAPRLLQSIFSAVGDFYLYRFSCRIFGERVARWALFSQLTNWFMFFCFSRTLANSLESVLTLIGLYYWPLFSGATRSRNVCSRKWGLAVAALACAIRPTSAITWLYVGLFELYETHDRLRFIFLEVTPIGIIVLALTSLLDWWMYESWIFVPLNFLRFNFLSSGGDYYGTHKWHWYFTQGFTVMVFTFLPFSIAGIFQSKQWKLFGLMAWVLGLYSVLGHKEFRFVLPVLPIALMFSGYSLANLSPVCSSENLKKGPSLCSRSPSRMQLAIFFLLVTNIPMALYMSLVHQRGSEDVMSFLAKEALDDKVKSVLFLMPCHATPYYSTLHRNLPMRFLDCTPSENKGTPDESDCFMMDPVGFVSEYIKDWSSSHSHIVLFDSEERQLNEVLSLHSFHELKRFFHAHFKVDRDLQASVVVYSSTDS